MKKIDNVEKEIRTLKFIIVLFAVLLITFAGFYFYEKMLNIYDKCNDPDVTGNSSTVVEKVYFNEVEKQDIADKTENVDE